MKSVKKLTDEELGEVIGGYLGESGPSQAECAKFGITKKKNIFSRDEYYVGFGEKQVRISKNEVIKAIAASKIDKGPWESLWDCMFC